MVNGVQLALHVQQYREEPLVIALRSRPIHPFHRQRFIVAIRPDGA